MAREDDITMSHLATDTAPLSDSSSKNQVNREQIELSVVWTSSEWLLPTLDPSREEEEVTRSQRDMM